MSLYSRHLLLSFLCITGIRRMATADTRNTSLTSHTYYTLKPLKLGAEVRGIQLGPADPPADVIQQIKNDVHTHRLLVFRDQGLISGDHHVAISRWFAEPDSTFYKHERSPHPDVFRVSNDEKEGCRGVGRTGWHIDGSFQEAPFGYSLYHIINVPNEGDTVFAGLTEIIEELNAEKRQKWERLSMVSNRRSGPIHPLVYAHPITGKPVLCFHLGMTDCYVWDYSTPNARYSTPQETSEIQAEIYEEFVKNNGDRQYSHKWTAGDFIISDNLALGHEASKQTQLPPSKVGLRVMHRVTTKGHRPPAKQYREPLKQVDSGDKQTQRDEL